jgi:crotonobetainyl-CoA:carnitine CoA-transferase CaiB-like acyl-CoA transferase
MMGKSVPPSEGLLVVDFSTLLPGPLVILVQAGTRFVKIERAGSGDDMRQYRPRWSLSSANFALSNAVKEGVSIGGI